MRISHTSIVSYDIPHLLHGRCVYLIPDAVGRGCIGDSSPCTQFTAPCPGNKPGDRQYRPESDRFLQHQIPDQYWSIIVETEMLSFRWNYNHRLQRKFSKLQLPVAMMTISLKLWHFCFNIVAQNNFHDAGYAVCFTNVFLSWFKLDGNPHLFSFQSKPPAALLLTWFNFNPSVDK